jgi:hypothetical protein
LHKGADRVKGVSTFDINCLVILFKINLCQMLRPQSIKIKNLSLDINDYMKLTTDAFNIKTIKYLNNHKIQ